MLLFCMEKETWCLFWNCRDSDFWNKNSYIFLSFFLFFLVGSNQSINREESKRVNGAGKTSGQLLLSRERNKGGKRTTALTRSK